MDSVSHVVFAGALTLSPGAMVFSLLPDIPLFNTGMKRLRPLTPPSAYLWTHSIWPVLFLWSLWPDAAIGWASHILLDVLSHHRLFSPRILYPLTWHVGGPFGEWEFFNRAWCLGMGVTVCIVAYRMVAIWSHVAR